jgi:hypothetical protein
MTPEQLADAILRAAGSGLHHYTMPNTRGAIISAAADALSQVSQEWQPIETAPRNRTMIMMIGVTRGNGFTGGAPYTTDPHCGWIDGEHYARWPHHWPPTHWKAVGSPPVTP